MKKITLLLLLLIFSTCTLSYAENSQPGINAVTTSYKFKNNKDAKRFSMLTNETRCVVCQFQNIADSKTPIAESLRNKIYMLINQNKSDEEIRNYLVKRYGEVILLKPRFNTATAILWLFPAIALLTLGLILLRFFRKKRISRI